MPHLVLTITAATLDAGRSAAYVKNLGDHILSEVTFRYGSQIIQSYPGYWQAMWSRVSRHDNHLEGRHAQVLGNLPPGAPTETVRENALVNALTLICPLDELYWHHNRDEYWMPEAHALEGELVINLAALARLVYSDNGASPFVGVGVAPTITNAIIRYRS